MIGFAMKDAGGYKASDMWGPLDQSVVATQ